MTVILRKEFKSHQGRRYINVNSPVFPLRLEPTSEQESNLESAKDSETKYLSEDSRDSVDSDVDLDSAVKQLQEFIPDIRERAATTIKRLYRDDLGRFKEFKAQGEFAELQYLLDFFMLITKP